MISYDNTHDVLYFLLVYYGLLCVIMGYPTQSILILSNLTYYCYFLPANFISYHSLILTGEHQKNNGRNERSIESKSVS